VYSKIFKKSNVSENNIFLNFIIKKIILISKEALVKFLKKSKFKIPNLTIISYLAALLLIILSYQLIFIVNESGVFDSQPYQYILNSSKANSYLIIALILVVIGSTFSILEKDK
jgi:hypothetical protein